MKWLFYVIVFIYMFYRAVLGAKPKENALLIESVEYDANKNFFVPGIRKTIICKGANKDQKVEWIDPTGNAVDRAPLNRVFVQEHSIPSFRTRIPALMLVFTNTIVEDSGVWECQAGGAKQNVSLCIIDPLQFVDNPIEVLVDSGRSITLSCQTRGDPDPRILWYRNGDILTDDANSKYKVMIKYDIQGIEGLLTMTSLGPEDSGAYTCEAIQESPLVDNCSHRQSLNISLQVNHAPIFDDGNDTTVVYGTEGESVELVCLANGFPIPTYRWFKEIDNDLFELVKENIELLNEGTKAVLRLTANASTLGQRFKCQATNQYGEVDKPFLFKKTEKPRKPSTIGVYKAYDDKVQLQVAWYENIYFPVYGIYVQRLALDSLKRKDAPREADWKRFGFIKLEEPESEYSEDDFKGIYLTLSNLVEDTAYWIRVRAVNSLGSSPWSDPTLASTVAISEEIEESEEEETTTASAPLSARVYSDSTFYGIFFAGGIFVIATGATFIMRLV